MNEDLSLEPTQEIYIRENGSRGVRSVPAGGTITQQQFKDDCDVNIIMAKLMRGQQSPHLALGKQGVYADLVGMPDYQESMQNIINAQNAFAEIPAEIRLAKFNNDPGKMIQFLSDPKNDDEAVQLGLKVRQPVPPDPNKSTIDAINNLASEIKVSKKKKSETSDE